MSVKRSRVTQPLQHYWGKYPALAWIVLLWLLTIATITLIWHTGSIGLIDETEPLFVEASRQMALTGDWVTPYFDGETRFDKPPLIYWLMVFAFQSLGINEFAARLPSVLAAIAIALFCFYALYRYGEAEGTEGKRQKAEGNYGEAEGRRQEAEGTEGKRQKAEGKRADSPLTPHSSLLTPHSSLLTPHLSLLTPHSPLLPAFLGATMLILNPNTFFWGRTAYSDMLLNACMGGSLLAFFLGYAQPDRPLQKRWYFAFYVLMALAVLTKGPIGILLPGLIIGCFLLYVGNGRAVLREMQWLRGGLVVVAIALPWYVLVTLANGEAFIDSFFGYHNVERFTQVVNHHAGPWYFHILVIVVGFLPWSAYLPAAIAHVKPLQRRYWQGQPRFQQLGLFALCWFLVILGFFTIATTKYFSYTLPLMPAAAILVALLWTDYVRQAQTRQHAGFIVSGVLNLLLLAIVTVAMIECPRWLGSDPWMPNLGLRLQEAGLPLLGGVIWGLTTIAAIGLLLWRSRWLWLVNLLGFLAFLILVAHPLVLIADIERQLPLRQLAEVAVQTKQPTEDLLMLGFKKPSLVFYTRQHVTYLTQPAQVISYLQSQTGDRTGALIVAGAKPLRQSGLQPQQYQEISRAGVYRLVRSQRR